MGRQGQKNKEAAKKGQGRKERNRGQDKERLNGDRKWKNCSSEGHHDFPRPLRHQGEERAVGMEMRLMSC